MKTVFRIAMTLSTAALLVSGCTHNIPRYGLSADNVSTLQRMKSSSSNKLATATFTSFEPGKNSIVCRAAGPVEVPDGKTYETYIRDALISELKIADMHSENSGTVINGHLEFIDFSSNIGAGNWIIKMKFWGQGSTPFLVENTYPFSTNFIADIACGQVAQAFVPATQDFIKKLVNDPQFVKIVQGK